MQTVTDVMNRDRTHNQRTYAAWLLKEAEANGLKLKSAAARDAFLLGAMLGTHCYPIFQASKPTSKQNTTATKGRRRAAR